MQNTKIIENMQKMQKYSQFLKASLTINADLPKHSFFEHNY